jgi:hypothetical protein
MDPVLLNVCQGQVVFLCKAALLALDDIQGHGAPESGRLWYGVQNFIIASGNLSKLFFAAGREPGRTQRYEARQPLRESLGVTNESPLRQVRIRNDFEHLDERLEEWWGESPNRNFIDAIVGPEGMIVAPEGALGEKDTLRWLNPETGNVIFWGNELHIPSVAEEVRRLLPLAERLSMTPPGMEPS